MIASLNAARRALFSLGLTCVSMTFKVFMFVCFSVALRAMADGATLEGVFV